jgi:hypothetical protein
VDAEVRFWLQVMVLQTVTAVRWLAGLKGHLYDLAYALRPCQHTKLKLIAVGASTTLQNRSAECHNSFTNGSLIFLSGNKTSWQRNIMKIPMLGRNLLDAKQGMARIRQSAKAPKRA